MDRSRFIAGLIGPTLIAVCVSLFVNQGMVAQMVEQLSADFTLIFISGVITLVAGLAIVLTHNIWRGWPAVVTAFGWLAVAGGLARILGPRQIAGFAPSIVDGPMVMVVAGLLLLLGLFLSFKAFRA